MRAPVRLLLVVAGSSLLGCAPLRLDLDVSPSAPASEQPTPTLPQPLAFDTDEPAHDESDPSPADELVGLGDLLLEVEEIGRVDPELKLRLLGQMRRTRPALWPPIVEAYRNVLDYVERERAAVQQPPDPAADLALKRVANPTSEALAAVDKAADPPAPPLPLPEEAAGEDGTGPRLRPAQSAAGSDTASSLTAKVEGLNAKVASDTTAPESLAAPAPLEVGQLAFCDQVRSYGVYRKFDSYRFHSGQEVLLYAEVEGFTTMQVGDSFHTTLASRYEILDSDGRPVAAHDFGTTEDVCRNRRRDFFMRYLLYMPEDIGEGDYTLQLTIDDVAGGKSGQAAIHFRLETPQGDVPLQARSASE